LNPPILSVPPDQVIAGFGGKAVTIRHGGPKPFSWSYSKLKNYEVCPKRTWHIDHKKDVKEEEGESLLWGNQVHKALADRISKGVALPKGMEKWEAWALKMIAGAGNPNVKLLVEQQLAINADFGATAWFPSDADKAGTGDPWYRGIGDVIKIVGPVALIIDWKTGKIIEDSQQLALMAACLFAHHPEVQKVRSEFIWLKENAETRADFDRADMPKMWAHLWPRIEALKNAVETTTFPAKPGGLCKRYCPVKACPHHGE
jgi:hypothetical protein